MSAPCRHCGIDGSNRISGQCLLEGFRKPHLARVQAVGDDIVGLPVFEPSNAGSSAVVVSHLLARHQSVTGAEIEDTTRHGRGRIEDRQHAL